MLTFATFTILVVAHQTAGSDDISQLLKKHPTWSFEVESVETLIKDVTPSLRLLDPNFSEDMLRAKVTASFGPKTTHIVRKVGDPKWLKKLPSTFDARDKWKPCADLIGSVEDEGACHTDGPAVASSVASDRYCIFTNGAFKERLSQEMLAGCAEVCTKAPYITSSFKYIYERGIPTGGVYKSQQGCVPTLQKPCVHNITDYLGDAEDEAKIMDKVKPCTEEFAFDHDCPTKCPNSKYSTDLDKDRKKFTTWYAVSRNEFAIRNEILAYGPVGTSIILYSDFFKHPEGIYRKSPDAQFVEWDKYLKLIGWGEENGTKYWLAVNTWDNWGSTKLFKIPRGVNYAWVEWFLPAGVYDDLDHPNH